MPIATTATGIISNINTNPIYPTLNIYKWLKSLLSELAALVPS